MTEVRELNGDSHPFVSTIRPEDNYELINGLRVFRFSSGEDKDCVEYNEFINHETIELGPTQERILDDGSCIIVAYYKQLVKKKKQPEEDGS